MVCVCVCVCSCVRKEEGMSCARVSEKEDDPNNLMYQVDVCVDVCVLMCVC
jgi:hypothetical protein